LAFCIAFYGGVKKSHAPDSVHDAGNIDIERIGQSVPETREDLGRKTFI